MKIHLSAIAGTAMASLAGLLRERGHEVTGSDQDIYPPMSTQLELLDLHGLPHLVQHHPQGQADPLEVRPQCREVVFRHRRQKQIGNGEFGN